MVVALAFLTVKQLVLLLKGCLLRLIEIPSMKVKQVVLLLRSTSLSS